VVSKPKIVNGAELKATTPHQLDFTLVKLNRFPAITDGLYLAGWDARADSPPNGICIHHPSGDVKKISVTKRALYTSDFGEGFNNNSHWLVSKWDIGTTEGGSSGASLFDSQYHIVGILSGGDATCDNSVNDYFAKFTLAWDFYPDSSKQLKYWLDPDNTGLRVLSGSAPYGLYKPGCDTVSNVLKTEGLANSSTGSWGYLSGHNSFNDDAFAEKFTISGSIDISGIFITPSVVTPGNAFANVVFKIWDGTDAPSHEIYSKPYYMKYLEPGMQNFIEFDSLVHLSGSFFIGYSINYASPADTFAMYHAENRNSGLSTMFVKRNNYWQIITDINSSFHTSMAIGFASCQPLEKPVNDELPIYPNPAFTDFYINLPLNTQASNLECFNMVGKKQYIEWHVETDKLVVDVRSLISGIYGLRFFINGKEYVKRFVVIQQK
jgi:lysyl endopeptidase